MRTSGTARITVLLAGVVAVTAILAWQAFDAARERRAVAEGALADYSAFAAAEFARRARDLLTEAALFGELRPALGVNAAVPPARLPPVSILVREPDWRQRITPAAAGAVTWFRLVTDGAALTTAGQPPDSAESAWLGAQLLPLAVRLMEQGRYFGMAIVPGSGGVAAFATRYADGRIAVLYGFVAPVAALGGVFDSLRAGPPLLPGARARLSNDDALAMEVVTAAGTAVWRSPGGMPPAQAAAESVGTQFAGMVARARVRPEAAAALLIGGMPRLPWIPLAISLGLAVALVVAALGLLRREAELAAVRDGFVAGVSHELRTPLAQIRLFAETLLLGRVRTDDERDRALRVIHDESRRLSHMVENLLQFSRAGSAHGSLLIEPVDASAAVRAAVAGFAPIAATRRAELVCDIEEGVTALADRDGLQQVLLNLLDNAVKYGPEGQQVTVRLARAGRLARLEVEDQGPGIPAADRGRVFERYARLDAARTTTGAGLGLAVVRELAGRMGATVQIADAEPHGAKFVVELPLASAAQ